MKEVNESKSRIEFIHEAHHTENIDKVDSIVTSVEQKNSFNELSDNLEKFCSRSTKVGSVVFVVTVELCVAFILASKHCVGRFTRVTLSSSGSVPRSSKNKSPRPPEDFAQSLRLVLQRLILVFLYWLLRPYKTLPYSEIV